MPKGRLEKLNATPVAHLKINNFEKIVRAGRAERGGRVDLSEAGDILTKGRGLGLAPSGPRVPGTYSHAMPQIHPENMARALSPDMLATDLAYYLVRKGVCVGLLGWMGDGTAMQPPPPFTRGGQRGHGHPE